MTASGVARWARERASADARTSTSTRSCDGWKRCTASCSNAAPASITRRGPGLSADVLVLCYHAVSPTWTAALSSTPGRFERQMERLVRRGYRGVTFTDAVTAAVRGRVLAVTFDDAFRSVFELARPILDRLGLPATVFVPTDFISEQSTLDWPGVGHWIGSAHEHELAPMSWAQMRTLAESGWEIGSHTGSHPRLT